MNTYNLNYNQLRQQPEISEMLSALERGFTKYRIDFYLVGAVARDVWMSGINKIEPRRTTRDIDFAVCIQSTQHISHLKHNLAYLEDGLFHKKERFSHLKHNLAYLGDGFFHEKERFSHLKHSLAYLEDGFYH